MGDEEPEKKKKQKKKRKLLLSVGRCVVGYPLHLQGACCVPTDTHSMWGA